jgi:hypothetical protein
LAPAGTRDRQRRSPPRLGTGIGCPERSELSCTGSEKRQRRSLAPAFQPEKGALARGVQEMSCNGKFLPGQKKKTPELGSFVIWGRYLRRFVPIFVRVLLSSKRHWAGTRDGP